MDEMKFPQQNNQEQPLVQSPANEKPSGKGFWIAISTVVLMVLVAGVIIFIKPNQQTPIATQADELKMLSETSDPVTGSVRRQAADLSILASQSAPVAVSREDKLKELESLK